MPFHQGRPWDGTIQWKQLKTSVHKAEVLGVPVFLFRPDNNWFKGKAIYGGPTTEAYLYFSRAALVRAWDLWESRVTCACLCVCVFSAAADSQRFPSLSWLLSHRSSSS